MHMHNFCILCICVHVIMYICMEVRVNVFKTLHRGYLHVGHAHLELSYLLLLLLSLCRQMEQVLQQLRQAGNNFLFVN